MAYESNAVPNYRPRTDSLIILSETCDLEHPGNIGYISFSPIFPLEVYIKSAVKLLAKKWGEETTFEKVVDAVSQKVYNVVNFQDKRLYFLPPADFLGDSASFSSIEQISHINFSYEEDLLARRKASMKSPWREKLAYKAGYLFNRVATPTPDHKAVFTWVENVYKETIKDSLG
ncbi:MAG: hypothetical protein KAR39_00240 [Thermoplasmata archaeon]|nr:hypothetical protein [Thermoplasmata archaeon]